jgi:hypothetical protein
LIERHVGDSVDRGTGITSVTVPFDALGVELRSHRIALIPPDQNNSTLAVSRDAGAVLDASLVADDNPTGTPLGPSITVEPLGEDVIVATEALVLPDRNDAALAIAAGDRVSLVLWGRRHGHAVLQLLRVAGHAGRQDDDGDQHGKELGLSHGHASWMFCADAQEVSRA